MQTFRNELLPAVVGKQDKLSQDGKKAIKRISGPRQLAFIKELLLAWLIIISAIGVAIVANNIFVSLLAIVIVATRQNVFVLLIHEQAHYLGIKNRYGDLLINFLAAYPLLLITVEDYAKVHMTHHKYFFKENDPDHIRKQGMNWSVPFSPTLLFKLFLTDLCGINVWRFYLGKRASLKTKRNQEFRRRLTIPSWVKPTYLILLVILITWLQAWSVVIIYWLLPLATIFQVIVRWGALCEHIYNLPNAAIEESTPMIILSWWERFLLPNLNFNYHLYHHYYPGISFTQLPKAHKIYVQEGLVNPKHVFHGYKSMFKYFLTGKQSTTE